jgi:predicted small integral membrane protein
MRKRGIALLVVAVIATLVAMANMLEYFFASKENLHKVEGVVDQVVNEAFRQGRSTYTKTTIVLEGSNDKYWLSDRVDVGGYIPAVKGDQLSLYVKSWYQWLYNYNWRSNIFYVERDGKMIYNNLSEWKGSGRAFMMVTAVLAALLWLIYFDVVKNKSISNWLRQQKR